MGVISRRLGGLIVLVGLGCAHEKRGEAGVSGRATAAVASTPSGAARTSKPGEALTPKAGEAPKPSANAVPGSAPSVSLESGAWTAGIVRKQPLVVGVALLRAVRAARHEGLDRVVFEFEGSTVGGYHVEYIDRPVRRCGSGDVAELEGDAWLAVTFEPAAAHTEAGLPLLAAREQRPRLDIVREIELTCDFEAQVSIVLGVAKPNRYRVLELSTPARLVIDIRR